MTQHEQRKAKRARQERARKMKAKASTPAALAKQERQLVRRRSAQTVNRNTGVYAIGKKWAAKIFHNGKLSSLGTYETQAQARNRLNEERAKIHKNPDHVVHGNTRPRNRVMTRKRKGGVYKKRAKWIVQLTPAGGNQPQKHFGTYDTKSEAEAARDRYIRQLEAMERAPKKRILHQMRRQKQT